MEVGVTGHNFESWPPKDHSFALNKPPGQLNFDFAGMIIRWSCTKVVNRLPIGNSRWPSWPWSYGSWIHNYLCNQCISPLKLWVWIPFMGRCTWYNINCGRLVLFYFTTNQFCRSRHSYFFGRHMERTWTALSKSPTNFITYSYIETTSPHPVT
jgi:hypothetical protein